MNSADLIGRLEEIGKKVAHSRDVMDDFEPVVEGKPQNPREAEAIRIYTEQVYTPQIVPLLEEFDDLYHKDPVGIRNAITKLFKRNTDAATVLTLIASDIDIVGENE